MNSEQINLNILGMSCVNCAKGIEDNIKNQVGILKAKVSFSSNEGNFLIDTKLFSKNQLISKIESLGYKVQEDITKVEEEQKYSLKKLKETFFSSIILTIFIFILSFSNFLQEDSNKLAIFFLASIVQFYCGARFYKLGYKALINRNYDMNVLVVLGTSAAYFFSTFIVFLPSLFPENLRFIYFDGAAVIISFVLLGKYLEENSKNKASDFLKKLITLTPLNATVIKGNDLEIIQAKDLKIKDFILVKTGEKIPADGEIIKGEADIDTAIITGESLPIFKEKGDEVLAGTLNTNGIIEIKVTKEPKDTTLSKIIELLKTAQSKQIPISRFADKIANIFVPLVLITSFITFLIWGVVIGDYKNAIVASITILIISCPCALGLATPIAIVSSVSKGAKDGILIKNPEILEEIKNIKYAIFDKTGTLTKGEISVNNTNIDPKYFDTIASIEKYSEHPISKAVVNYIKKQGFNENKDIEKIQIIPGFGIEAYLENQKILIGNKKLLDKHNILIQKQHLEYYYQDLENAKGSILVSIDKSSIGSFSLEDKLKEDAINTIQELKNKNIRPVLLTGDNKITANIVAKKLNIETVFSEVTPSEKYKVIKELQSDSKVMFIGDGINDAPSIKQANIGITLNSGADISKDAGDIILINNELKAVSKSINLSIETMKIVKQNLFWAFAYNILGIPLAAGVLYPFFGIMLTPMYAGIAMSFSSVSVVLNSLRLKTKKL